ncbi:glucitol/sorbitol-specific enzyme IIB component of PTS [Tepidanaerobacter acetatoxydans Re1]|uniref:Glucitol/sorbitol-specific enzyme IIB component of PTS n=1 Tax=Tepidanaerobacter acetatoxydans (strain DSM 21804 / JCM 16047 / Re1) TaxID=1209989 RepID=F4LXQ4_TEPAE|nr:PTS glucitol/sorbitol transporter subunit IIB [Tepidanaerobacter acetatoxydans]AEE91983.1 Protein-N(pi)-phosphohistidine--sugar phosphotransferase [Tepidanaerobacter acetatoxydans Re1]CCP26822.1 glucitol/sorbitol-specific enzyme IIB component of PTS [Tepidanaerobacter acetatoxydans Re1]
MSKVVKVTKGKGGFGGPLYLERKGKCNKIVSMTGRNIDPIAEYIGKLLGAEIVNGFNTSVPDDEVICIVVNCGGSLRCGLYPQKGIPTININAIGPSGPLAKYIKENIYVSGVTKENIELIEKEETNRVENRRSSADNFMQEKNTEKNFVKLIEKLASAMSKVISMLYGSGKEAVQTVIHMVIPFMAFISVIVTLILHSGVGTYVANALSPLTSSLWGLIVIAFICGIPFLSPLLGPGAAIQQVLSVVIGAEIAIGNVPVALALPALFAIDVQVGADFVPVGLSMQEAQPQTIEYGTPAFLLSRQITGPLAVLLGYFMSIGLF